MTDKEIRKMSRALNKGHYGTNFSIIAYSSVSAIFFCSAPYFVIKLLDMFKGSLESINIYLYPTVCSAAMLIMTLACLVTFSSVSLGEKAWYSGHMTRKKNCGKRLRFWFIPKHSFKAFRLQALLFILRSCWTTILLSPAALAFVGIVSLAYSGGIELYLFISMSVGGLLLLISGIIFRFIIIQRYFLAPYLLAADPKLKPMQAIKQSKNLLEGHIFRIVKFKLKYLPSFLLYPFLIPIIFFLPEYKQSCTLIAKEICL